VKLKRSIWTASVSAALVLAACSSTDLKAVCAGVGTESEVAYGSGDPPFLVYSVTGDGESYDEFTEAGIRSEWRWTDRDQRVDLVLCLDRVQVISDGLCPFESQGTQWDVEPFSVRYGATLREAQTATVIDTAEFFAQSAGCPMFSVHREGSPSPVASYASELVGIETFLEPHVTGIPAVAESEVAESEVTTTSPGPLYSGEKLSVFLQPDPFVANKPFHIEHGFGDEDAADGRDYRLSIDGVPHEGHLVVVEDGGVFGITRVFDFPNGLDRGTHLFESEWLEDGDVVLETSWSVVFR
jgi:hypothetical protein